MRLWGVIALALLIAGTGTLVLATLDHPAPARLAPPAVGMQAVYTVAQPDGGINEAGVLVAGHHQMLGPDAIRVPVLRVHYWSGSPTSAGTGYVQTDGRPFAIEVVGVAATPREHDRIATLRWGEPLPCPFSLMGVAIHNGDRLPGCSSATWYDRGVVPALHGREATRFSSSAGTLDIVADLPVPVAWTMHSTEGTIHATLRAYAPGQNQPPRPAEDATRRSVVLPEPEIVATTRFGVDVGDVSHRYPVQDAVRDAQTDDDARRAFVDDWRVVAATHSWRDTEATETDSWVLDVSTGYRVFISQRHEAPAPIPGGPVPIPLPGDARPGWRTVTTTSIEALMEPPESLPLLAPTIASVAAQWQAYEGHGEPPRSYSFYACRECPGGLRVEAGNVIRGVIDAGSAFPVMDNTAPHNGTAWQVNGDGTPAAYVRSAYHVTPWRPAATVAGLPPPATDIDWPTIAWSSVLVATLAAVAKVAFGLVAQARVLQHPVRRDLMAIVMASPGIHQQELARRVGVGHGNLEHHLARLVRTRLLVATRSDHYTCYFGRGQVDRRAMDAAPYLKSPGAWAVIDAIQSGAVTGQAIVVRTGLAAGTVGFHLKRLRNAGLVAATRDGRTVQLALSSKGRAVIGAWRPGEAAGAVASV